MFDNAPLLRSLQVQFASYGINAAQYAAELLQPQLVEESTGYAHEIVSDWYVEKG